MAHSAMHFGAGLATGTVACLPFLKEALKTDTSRNAGYWLAAAYGLGCFAVVPSLLGLLGVPESITSAWFMNIFLFHPIIDYLKSGGKLIGETLIVSCFLFQYSIMLLLLWQTKKRRQN